jgi:CMP/dCMP kinase
MAIITIARQVGSDGDAIATRVCKALGYYYFDKTLMTRIAKEQGLAETEVVDFSEESYHVRSFIDALFRRSQPVGTTVVHASTTSGEEARVTQTLDEEMAIDLVTAIIRGLQKRGQVVVVGRGGQAILRDQPGVLHVRIVARQEDRVQNLIQTSGLTNEGALATINDRDRAAAEYLQRFHGVDWADPALYHLTINTSLVREQLATDLIVTAAQRVDDLSPSESSSSVDQETMIERAN